MHYQLLKIPTTGKSLCKITSKVEAIVAESGWKPGTLFFTPYLSQFTHPKTLIRMYSKI